MDYQPSGEGSDCTHALFAPFCKLGPQQRVAGTEKSHATAWDEPSVAGTVLSVGLVDKYIAIVRPVRQIINYYDRVDARPQDVLPTQINQIVIDDQDSASPRSGA